METIDCNCYNKLAKEKGRESSGFLDSKERKIICIIHHQTKQGSLSAMKKSWKPWPMQRLTKNNEELIDKIIGKAKLKRD